jgi:predicted RNase H-like nuclease (RuvC/YqgF family)
LIAIIEKYDELNKKYMMMKSQLAEARKVLKGKRVEVVEVDLVTKKNEVKVLRVKLSKQREKVKHLSENLTTLEKHKTRLMLTTILRTKTTCYLYRKQ